MVTEYVEVTRLGGRREFLRVDPPIDFASMLRREYLAGEIGVEQFEAELEAILRGNPPARFEKFISPFSRPDMEIR